MLIFIYYIYIYSLNSYLSELHNLYTEIIIVLHKVTVKTVSSDNDIIRCFKRCLKLIDSFILLILKTRNRITKYLDNIFFYSFITTKYTR